MFLKIWCCLQVCCPRENSNTVSSVQRCQQKPIVIVIVILIDCWISDMNNSGHLI